MRDCNIRKMTDNEITKVVDIWFQASVIAHDFIQNDYWEENKKAMENEYLPMSETYVAADGKNVYGFISLIDDYLAALFVPPEIQNSGIGSSLLKYAKNIRDILRLKVYVKNSRSIKFYKANGFTIESEAVDEETGENEYIMEWHK